MSLSRWCPERAPGVFALTTVTLAGLHLSDERTMHTGDDNSRDAQFKEQLPGLTLRAFSVDDQRDLLQSLSLLLVTSGGWLLKHRRPSQGILQVIFEFQRSAAVDIYVMLVSLGLELTANSHKALTGFCQRTVDLPAAQTMLVAVCELEIRDLADEASSPEQLFGAAAIA